MKKYAVLGLGHFGYGVAVHLAERGQEVLAIDRDPDLVQRIKDKVPHAVCADVTDEEAIRQLDVDEVEAAIVAIGEDQLGAILATAILRKIGVGRIIARAISPIHRRILLLIGANEVVSPEGDLGRQLAERLTTPGFLELMKFTSGRRLVEIQAKPDWVGQTIGEVGFRAEFGVNVIAIRRNKPAVTDTGENVFEEELNDMPGPDDRLDESDVLVLIGPQERIDALRSGA